MRSLEARWNTKKASSDRKLKDLEADLKIETAERDKLQTKYDSHKDERSVLTFCIDAASWITKPRSYLWRILD